jgi:steroid delta-isomerase-like uncharacterized protein
MKPPCGVGFVIAVREPVMLGSFRDLVHSKEANMSPVDNKTLNERWVQAFNDRDWAAEAAFRTGDYVAHMQGAPSPLNADGWTAFLGVFATAFPDGKIVVDGAISEGDTVASRWTMSGTHGGEFQGVPPTGRQVTMKGIDFSRVVEGKIAEHWAEFDVIGVMQQIGAIPAPA